MPHIRPAPRSMQPFASRADEPVRFNHGWLVKILSRRPDCPVRPRPQSYESGNLTSNLQPPACTSFLFSSLASISPYHCSQTARTPSPDIVAMHTRCRSNSRGWCTGINRASDADVQLSALSSQLSALSGNKSIYATFILHP